MRTSARVLQQVGGLVTGLCRSAGDFAHWAVEGFGYQAAGVSRAVRRGSGAGSRRLAAEVNPRSPTHTILARVHSRRLALAWRISAVSVVLPGQHHTHRITSNLASYKPN